MSSACVLVPEERLTVKSLVSSLELIIWRRGEDLSVSLFRQDKKKYVSTSVAFATSPISRTRVETDNRRATLWIGSAAFDVTSANGELILTTFGIDREDTRKEPA